MIDINLGKGKSVSIHQFARTIVKETLRTQLMLKSTLIRLEEMKVLHKDEEFEMQTISALLQRIDDKTNEAYDILVAQMKKGG